MHDVRHVLFPADFSPRCLATIPFVKEMVRRSHASLTLLHVAEIPFSWYATMQPEAPVAWNAFQEIEEKARERLIAFGCDFFLQRDQQSFLGTTDSSFFIEGNLLFFHSRLDLVAGQPNILGGFVPRVGIRSHF